jgi:hypothetical protein
MRASAVSCIRADGRGADCWQRCSAATSPRATECPPLGEENPMARTAEPTTPYSWLCTALSHSAQRRYDPALTPQARWTGGRS